jgi:hypothetical protein
MRSFIPVLAAVALSFALAPFIAGAWPNPSVAGGPLPSISVHDLTLASGSLTALDYTDAH